MQLLSVGILSKENTEQLVYLKSLLAHEPLAFLAVSDL
jgi:hypothetical protein